jgi:hypothetical protein
VGRAGDPRPAAFGSPTGRLSDSGNMAVFGKSREPTDSWRIVLKKMQNLRSCHASMLLAFGRPAVLACRRVLKSAES